MQQHSLFGRNSSGDIIALEEVGNRSEPSDNRVVYNNLANDCEKLDPVKHSCVVYPANYGTYK